MPVESQINLGGPVSWRLPPARPRVSGSLIRGGLGVYGSIFETGHAKVGTASMVWCRLGWCLGVSISCWLSIVFRAGVYAECKHVLVRRRSTIPAQSHRNVDRIIFWCHLLFRQYQPPWAVESTRPAAAVLARKTSANHICSQGSRL